MYLYCIIGYLSERNVPYGKDVSSFPTTKLQGIFKSLFLLYMRIDPTYYTRKYMSDSK